MANSLRISHTTFPISHGTFLFLKIPSSDPGETVLLPLLMIENKFGDNQKQETTFNASSNRNVEYIY